MDKFFLIGYVSLPDQENKEKVGAYLLYFTQPVLRGGAGSIPCCAPGKNFSAVVSSDRFRSLDLKVGCQYEGFCTRVKGGVYIVVDSLHLCK